MTKSTSFDSTFAVFSNAQSHSRNCKRASKPTHNNSTNNSQTTTEKKGEGITAVWSNGGRSASYDSEVPTSSFVHLRKFSSENQPQR